MKNRIKQIRKECHLTQVEFGKRVGVKGNTITNYENGLRTPSDAVLVSICREFGINEVWLRTGEGCMELSEQDKFSAYLNTVLNGEDTFIRDLLEVYMELDQSSKDALRKISNKMVEKQQQKKTENNKQADS